jgi:cyclophilin family peptidyl-prolyl cis-trans isomerase
MRLHDQGGHVKITTFAAALLVIAACAPAKQNDSASTKQPDTAVAAQATTDNASQTTSEDLQPQFSSSKTTAKAGAKREKKPMTDYKDKVAEIHTSAGEIDIRFFPDVAPNHVKNFIDLAQKGFYNGTKFHRIIPGFMVQGGDPNTKTSNTSSWGTGGSGTNVKAEFNSISHKRGIVSMARSNDPNSASSQFFVVVKDSPFLDKQYTVFGEVTKGMDIADKIVNAPRNAQDRPDNPVSIDSVKIRAANANEKGPAPK